MTTTKTLSAIILTLMAITAHAAPAAFRTKFPRKLIKGQQVLVCKRVKVPPKIDGEVDKDPVWRTCDYTKSAWVELGSLKQISGRQTVVYTCFDEKKLYFGFVCEETDLSRVRMHGKLESTDNVEVALEIGGLMGDGDVLSYMANIQKRSQVMGRPYRSGPNPFPWQAVGKLGPNRWMVEMAIPFSSMKRPRSRKSISCPQRGDLIGIKFARHGKLLKSGEQRMISTFNAQIPFRYLYLCGYNDLLYFEDSNVLEDEDFNADPGLSPWKRHGSVKERKKGVALGKGAKVSQAVKLKENSSYALTLDTKGRGSIRVYVDGNEVKLKENRSGSFWHKGEKDKPSNMCIKAEGAVDIRRIEMRYEPGIEPPGTWCLTNNYVKPERNISSKLRDVPEGRYHYVSLDYANRFQSDANPAIKIKRWPYGDSYHLRVEDLGGRKGWIPFSKGSLTGRPESVFWLTVRGSVGWGRHKHVVLDIDLGQEYFVTGFDLHWPAPYMTNSEIWGKPDRAEHWTLLHVANSEFVEPAKRIRYARGYESVRGLNSVVRFLRSRATGLVPKFPEMDGVQEFWVWGEPKGKHAGITTFKPWISSKKAPPIEPETWTPDRKWAQIIPTPRKLTRAQGRLILTEKSRIIFQDEPDARKTARQIRDEIRERWSVELAVVPEKDVNEISSGTIYLGQPRLGDIALSQAKRTGLIVDSDKLAPQGYGLLVTPESAVVLGRDGDGLYWGVQSLMMAMRWYQSEDPEKSGPSIQAMKILDWPGTLERSMHTSIKNYPAFLMVPVSEISRIKRICHLLSRFKYNVVYVPAERIGEGKPWLKSAYEWPEGTLARLCREIQEEYHIELRPDIFSSEIEGGGWFSSILSSNKTWGQGEFDPDESAKDLGMSLNLCPLDPETHDMVFKKIDRILEQFDWPSQVIMYGQIYHSVKFGARWAVCRRCQLSHKNPAELYGYFLQQISGHLKKRGAVGLLRDEQLSYGTVGKSPDRLDILNVPRNFRVDMSVFAPLQKDQQAIRDYLTRFVPHEFVVNGPAGWPSKERITGGSNNIQGILNNFAGNFNHLNLWEQRGGKGNLSRSAQSLWYAPDPPPSTAIDYAGLGVWLNSWWYQRDFPSWRHGKAPVYYPIDISSVVNHLSHPSGTELLEAGRAREIDLRYLKTGTQVLGGIQFDIIDPAKNNGKAILMLGRPPANTHPKALASIFETAGPIPVNRKLTSLAFLRTRWCSQHRGGEPGGWHWWLRPTCRVVYDDESWLVVDAFTYITDVSLQTQWTNTQSVGLCSRLGWRGNCPDGQTVALNMVEWVNPYPEKTIKYLDFFTPDMEDYKGKRVNPFVEAIIAITGVGVAEQDLKFWKEKKGKMPRLPALCKLSANRIKLVDTPPRPGGRMWQSGGANIKKWKGTLSGQDIKISYTARMMQDTLYYPYGRYAGVTIRKGFFPFGVTLAFARPIHLHSVDLSGPIHMAGQNQINAISGQHHKVDVMVEVSEDGKTWKRAGNLNGISVESGFLSIRLPETKIKALRMTGTGAPYHQYYQLNNKYGLLNLAYECPLFGWRLYAPASAEK